MSDFPYIPPPVAPPIGVFLNPTATTEDIASIMNNHAEYMKEYREGVAKLIKQHLESQARIQEQQHRFDKFRRAELKRSIAFAKSTI